MEKRCDDDLIFRKLVMESNFGAAAARCPKTFFDLARK